MSKPKRMYTSHVWGKEESKRHDIEVVLEDDIDRWLTEEVLPVLKAWSDDMVCTCHPSYTERKLIDPECSFHEWDRELTITRALIAELEGE